MKWINPGLMALFDGVYLPTDRQLREQPKTTSNTGYAININQSSGVRKQVEPTKESWIAFDVRSSAYVDGKCIFGSVK